jgi:hypothetical protein
VSDLVIDPMSSAFSAAFRYVKVVTEIMFIGILASCLLVAATFFAGIGLSDIVQGAAAASPDSSSEDASKQHKDQLQRSFQSTFLGNQLDSLMVNIQRTFADVVGNLIPDAEARRMVVFLGLCMLPATSVKNRQQHLHSRGDGSQHASDNYSMLEEFFLVFQPTGKKSMAHQVRTSGGVANNGPAMLWRTYAGLITKIWVTGISMAWINTTLGFILPPKPSQSSKQQSAFSVTINLVASICLAFMTKALNNTFSGITVFQNYIEWNVATTSVAYIDLVSSSSSSSSSKQRGLSLPVTPLIVGLAFYAANELLLHSHHPLEPVKEGSGATAGGGKHAQQQPRYSSSVGSFSTALQASLQTVHSTLLIMLTNSLVSYAMRVVSTPAAHGAGIASLASVVVGMVAARTVMRVVHMVCSTRTWC